MMSFGSQRGVSTEKKTTMHRPTLEEEEVAGRELDHIRRIIHPESSSSGEDDEVLIRVDVEVWWSRTIDAEDTSAGGSFIGQVDVKQHRICRLGKGLRDLVQFEPAEGLFCH